MAEIDQIIEKLRRQRSELDVAISDTTLSGTVDEIVNKLEELRRRSDAVNGPRAPSAPQTSET